MNKYYRTNQLLEVAQAAHRNKAIIHLKVTTEGGETNWLNISVDELRDIANITYIDDNGGK